MRTIQKYELSSRQVVPYFDRHVKSGKSLSKIVLELVDLYKGTFFTLLPLSVNTERLYLFSQGGIIPAIPYGAKTYKIENVSDNFHPQQVRTMDKELSQFIYNYLQTDQKNYALLEEPLRDSDDLHDENPNIKILFFGKEVYYLLTSQNSIKEIYEAIRMAGNPWHFLAILTSSEHNFLPQKLSEESFRLACLGLQFIIVGAYDDEAYLFWRRDHRSAYM